MLGGGTPNSARSLQLVPRHQCVTQAGASERSASSGLTEPNNLSMRAAASLSLRPRVPPGQSRVIPAVQRRTHCESVLPTADGQGPMRGTFGGDQPSSDSIARKWEVGFKFTLCRATWQPMQSWLLLTSQAAR